MKIIIKDNKEEIAELVSKRIIDKINSKKGHAVLGLATGSTPIPTYQKLIHAYHRGEVSFKYVTTFNLDEYLDNGYELLSYRATMNRDLFNQVDIEKKCTNFPSVNNMFQYDEMIAKAGGIDIQLLGIGRDGHIGFNEPGTLFTSTTHVSELDEMTRKDNSRFFPNLDEVPTRSITMGLRTIFMAKEIILIATGTNKAEIIRDLVKNKPSVDLPASILKNHPDTTIYLDKDAASLLE